MTKPQWRKPCLDGCTCGKHRKRTCEPGCMCSRHSAQRGPSRKCEPGCTCGHHRKQACEPGCTCARHGAQAGRKYTEEQSAEALERKRAKNRDYMFHKRLNNPEWAKANDAKKASAESRKRWLLKSKYGMTLEQWDARIAAQSGRCYLCSDPLDPAHIHVDHSHACCPGSRSCGSCIRGLACRWCNQGIGQFRDDPERMRRAAIALERAEATITAALARTRIDRE